MNWKEIIENLSSGVATVEENCIIAGGAPKICVGILGTTKIIAVCGPSNAADKKESLANAFLIATLWNKYMQGR